MNNSQNCVALSGVLLSRESRRYSPAGVAFCNALLSAESEVEENGVKRRVGFEIQVIAAGEMVFRLESLPLNTPATFHGFLAPLSQRKKALVLHIQSIEIF